MKGGHNSKLGGADTMSRVYEQGNRRAEVHGTAVQYFRITGAKKKGLVGVWFYECEDEKKAKRLAQRWAFMAKLSS